MDAQAASGSGTHEERGEPNGRPKASFVGYYLDESDPDILILRRHDDSFVAAFSASGATTAFLEIPDPSILRTPDI
jgi:hypothetical protein